MGTRYYRTYAKKLLQIEKINLHISNKLLIFDLYQLNQITMTKIYYTVEKHIADDGETLDGTKTVFVYEIQNNEPVLITELGIDLTEHSEDAIRDYLDDNDDVRAVTFEQL